ncbi:hypothetical protein B0T19DRAFT_115445 [Cercophora scortea]|uniref:Uncharacterized protein n=1 Tax=Cercophora scortea TaxID=314031 RepID=A0AAE0MJ70_9PEZI|nr:hypothetical protein B0T19DRAFT_115445 [Cercophora scortea]
MSSIGRIAGSTVSMTNENTVALVNINLDFSLWRCDPAPEFLPIGSALTVGRKKEAETGQSHRTACKLGFLFHELIPDVPKLIKAYGRRVSEILASPDINPQGTESDGPFKPFIGADCTSIWAAATSGSASIGALLLACMLADSFDAKVATATWVEIVEERKRRVQADVDAQKLVNPHTAAAAQQEFTREELASWDTSVRSWLPRAATSMSFRRTQFALISDNLTIPYPRGGSTYETVMLTWRRAMEVLEKLLDNLPQQACDRAVICGIRSWHLYPDLLVFQTEATKVSFNDPLFPNSGILSLGLEYKGKPAEGFVSWSLALSHLKYYGDPVPVRSSEQLSRVRMSQLWLVTLGAIFSQWNIPYTSFNTALAWFQELGKKLNPVHDQRHKLSWLLQLCTAATDLDGDEGQVAPLLVKYGWRRGARFLGDKAHHGMREPFFGLCNPHIMGSLDHKADVECGIEYLRRVSSILHLGEEDAVIEYHGNLLGHDYRELATVHPIEYHLAERGDVSRGEMSAPKRHARWLHYRVPDDPMGEAEFERAVDERRREIEAMGESCKIVVGEEYMLSARPKSDDKRKSLWRNPPNLFQKRSPVELRHFTGPWEFTITSFDLWVIDKPVDSVHLQPLTPAQLKVGLGKLVTPEQGLTWLRGMASTEKLLGYFLAIVNYHPTVTLSISGQQVQKRNASRGLKRKHSAQQDVHTVDTTNESILDHGMAAFKKEPDVDKGDPTGCFLLITAHIHRPTNWLLSLRSLEIATQVYKTLPGATVSCEVAEQELLKARWLPVSITNMIQAEANIIRHFKDAASISVAQHLSKMTRAQCFACVAMFQSGRFNIDPEKLNEVVALCSEDSIFVAEILLSDPSADPSRLGIRHMVGNIGKTGMTFMVSPLEPRIRPLGHDASLVSHRGYDGAHGNSFKGTSLHLSFTTWTMPLEWENTGEIDQETFLRESVVSVQDNGKWVADIDVLGIEKSCPDVISFQDCDCKSDPNGQALTQNVVSIESWEEFLDKPPCVGVLQTNDNWVARLAAVSILIQQGNGHTAIILDKGEICWNCLEEAYSDPEPHIPQFIII